MLSEVSSDEATINKTLRFMFSTVTSLEIQPNRLEPESDLQCESHQLEELTKITAGTAVKP